MKERKNMSLKFLLKNHVNFKSLETLFDKLIKYLLQNLKMYKEIITNNFIFKILTLKTNLQYSSSADKFIPLFQSEVKFLILQSGNTA